MTYRDRLRGGPPAERREIMEIEIAMRAHETLWGVPVGPHPAMLRWRDLYRQRDGLRRRDGR